MEHADTDQKQSPDAPDGPPKGRADRAGHRARLRETIALVLLAVTAILTAWCGFESGKWGGEMSIAFSRASTARIEAARQQGIANNAQQLDLSIYAIYVQAEAEGDTMLAGYVRARFTDEFKVAYDAWVAAGRPTNAPFTMPEYVPPGETEAAAADERADQQFAQALVNNQRGDDYRLLTVLAALVLFFTALSGRPGRPELQWAALGLALILFLLGAILSATYPVLL